jgi:hypothetical protein
MVNGVKGITSVIQSPDEPIATRGDISRMEVMVVGVKVSDGVAEPAEPQTKRYQSGIKTHLKSVSAPQAKQIGVKTHFTSVMQVALPDPCYLKKDPGDLPLPLMEDHPAHRGVAQPRRLYGPFVALAPLLEGNPTRAWARGHASATPRRVFTFGPSLGPTPFRPKASRSCLAVSPNSQTPG